MISNDELKKLAKELIGGIDEFYAELHTLKSDIEFFNMYNSRNRKSKFELNVMFKNSNFMNVLYNSHAKNIDYLDIILSYYIVIKAVINDIHENTNKFTIEKRKYNRRDSDWTCVDRICFYLLRQITTLPSRTALRRSPYGLLP